MIDLMKMFAALAEEPWATMKILADALEEAGDPRAMGYRMLAKHKKWPNCDSSGTFRWYDAFRFPNDMLDALPTNVFKKLKTACDEACEGTYMGAFDAAAIAWAEVIREGGSSD